MPPTRILQDFLRRLFADQDAGTVRSLEEYQALYPGHEEAVAQAFRAAGNSGAGALATFSELPAAATLEEGRRLGPYRLLETLGRGGQGDVLGAVFLARDERLNRNVAVKVMATLSPLQADETLSRFRREAEVTSRLNHPGICAIYEMETYDGIPCIVMPYVEGRTLALLIAAARRVGRGRDPPLWSCPGARTSRGPGHRRSRLGTTAPRARRPGWRSPASSTPSRRPRGPST